MSRWRFALTARWAGYLSLVVVFAIVSCSLGIWQFERRAEAHAEVLRIEGNYDAPPSPLVDLLPRLDSFRQSQKWSQVAVTGTYLTGDELLVRTRPLSGNPGFEVLTPLLLKNGDVFVIDRGWVPVGSAQDAPDHVPAAPSGEVTVIARLKAGEPALAGRTAPRGQIATIELHRIAALLDRPTYTGAYGIVADENPAPAERPIALPKPPLDEGPHLSYAFQWFVFALLAFVGLGWALRQEYRLVNSEDPAERERARERQRRKDAKLPSDAEVEDSILDRR